MFTPQVSFAEATAAVGQSLSAYWAADPGTGTFTYRATVDGAPWFSSSVDGAPGAVSGVSVNTDQAGTVCIYVTAIAVPGVTAPGWTNSMESSPACAVVTWGGSGSTATTMGPAASPVAGGALPTPSGWGVSTGSAVEFQWTATDSPHLSHYGIRIMHKGQSIGHGQASGGSYVHHLGEYATPGQYCAGVIAIATPGSGAVNSARTRICVTV